MSKMRFVSLHSHSTFSYGDGFGPPKAHVERVAELGMSALALTEHGNVSSHVQLEKAAIAAGIKPIFGLEAYTAPVDMRTMLYTNEKGVTSTGNQRKWHLGLLAKNQEGYVNLNKIVGDSWADGFYRWPTVSGPMLAEHREGIVVLSGCSDSLLACTLLGGKGIPIPDKPNYKGALGVVRGFQKLFGDDYYLEVQQMPELARTGVLNKIYARLSEETGVPLVATADVHYPYPEDNEMQKILHAAGRNTGTVAAAEAEWEYDILLTYPTSDEYIHERLMRTGLTAAQADKAIDSTAEIAEKCNVVLTKSEQLRFPLPAGVGSAEELVWIWLREGWKYRWDRNAHMRANKKAYHDRLVYEMSQIVPKDYCDYFLTISEATRWAKSPEVSLPVGPARGSAAASLVCYALRITEVDPMQFPTMMFERFIDVTRMDLPDIDLDFADDRRWELRQHLAELYGADHVGNIGNFTRYRGKNAINDVARVHSIPKFEAKIVNDLVIERSGGDSRFDASLADTRDMFPQAAEVFERWPDLEYAIRLEGNYKSMGVHAAGLVVSKEPISATSAVYRREVPKDSGHWVDVIAYDKKDAEYLGMLKIDALGLKTMGMIDIALNTIGMTLDELYQLPLDDPETIAAFTRGDVVGIFQFEGRATRLMTLEVAPDNFMEIADINALSRPGPLFSGASASYIDIKHGRVDPVRLHAIVDKYTEQSKYQIIYQEQVLGIIREMGGFPVSKVGDIRRIISQKLGEASFNSMREEFINGAWNNHKVEEELADRIWKLMVTSATYSFNIAHCVSGDTVINISGGNKAQPNHRSTCTVKELWDRMYGIPYREPYADGSVGRNSKKFEGPCMRCGEFSTKSVNAYSKGWCGRCKCWREALHKRGLRIFALDEADGRIRPDNMIDVMHMGVKPVIRLTLRDGKSIKVTEDHQMRTEDGWVEAGKLSVGEKIMINAGSDTVQTTQNTWFGGNGGERSFREWRKQVPEECEFCESTKYLEGSHKDGDRTNNSWDNLQLLCARCHRAYDRDHNGSRYGYWHKGFAHGYSDIVSIEEAGEEEVFDLSMEGAGHNFIANGMVVHNCISYGMLAYWAMWLKVHHPLAFYAAQLSKNKEKADWPPLIKDCERHGIPVLPPDLRYSHTTWHAHPTERAVLAGITQVPGIAEKSAKTIFDWLEDKDRKNVQWQDLIAIKGIGAKTVDKIGRWVDGDDPFDLYYAQRVLGELRTAIKKYQLRLPTYLIPTHTSDTIPRDADNLWVSWMGIPKVREYKDFIEDERARSGRTNEEIMATMQSPDLVKSGVLKCYDDGDEEVYLRFNRFKFPKFREILEGVKLDGSQVVVIKGNKRRGFGINIQVHEMITIDVGVDEEEEDDEGAS